MRSIEKTREIKLKKQSVAFILTRGYIPLERGEFRDLENIKTSSIGYKIAE